MASFSSFLRRLGHVLVHRRRYWQFVLSSLLVCYNVIDSGNQVVKSRHIDLPAAARNCTLSCTAICALPSGVFEESSAGIAGFERWSFSDPLWPDVPVRLPDGTRGHAFIKHGRDVWWADPRDQTIFCQWGWKRQAWDGRYDLWNNAVYDVQANGPRSRLWMDMPGKYYSNYSSDRIQNWVTTTPDAVVQGSVRPYVIWVFGHPVLYGMLAVLSCSLLWTLSATRRSAFGSLGYILQLESLANTRGNTVIKATYVGSYVLVLAVGFRALTTYDFIDDESAPLYWTRCGVAILVLSVSLYTLLTETTPITARMLLQADKLLPLPVFWYTSTRTTLARAFVAVLLPERIIIEVQQSQAFDVMDKHVDPYFLKHMSEADVLAIKSMWRLDENREVEELELPKLVKHVRVAWAERDKSGSWQPLEDTASLDRHDRRTSGSLDGRNRPMPRDSGQAVSDFFSSAPLHELKGEQRLPLRSDSFLKHLHLICSLREWWVLLGSYASYLPRLIELVVLPPSFITECICSCNSTAPTIQECYDRFVRERGRIAPWRYVFTSIGAVFILSLMIARVRHDLKQVEFCRYGTFEYILRLELRKRSRGHRANARVGVIFVTLTFVILIITAIGLDPSWTRFWDLFAQLWNLVAMLIAGGILIAEVGILTPASVVDCPDISLPMRFYQPSEAVLASILTLAMLRDDELRALPSNLQVLHNQGMHISPRLARLPCSDLLALKRHIRKEDSQTFVNESRRQRLEKQVNQRSWAERSVMSLLNITGAAQVLPDSWSEGGVSFEEE